MTTQQGTRQLHTMVGSRLAVESSVAASMSVQCCDCDSSSADAAVNHVVVLKRVAMSLFSSRKLCLQKHVGHSVSKSRKELVTVLTSAMIYTCSALGYSFVFGVIVKSITP